MRVAIITESFLPDMNGVTNSVLKVADHLTSTGHDVLIMAPDSPGMPSSYRGASVVGMTSLPFPGYKQVRVTTTPQISLEWTLAEFSPHVVHLASPINVGYRGVLAADALDLPSVAVYQTDIPGYAARYKVPALEAWLWGRVKRIHTTATVNLAPSTASINQLKKVGIDDVALWGRGVDSDLFNPGRRDEALRASWAPAHHRIVGYMGRLAPEKQVADLAALADLPNTTIVVIGGGPERPALEQALPNAVFTGELRGEDLARAVASLDLFVHPGELETFGQTIQEAMASGLPVVAPASGGPIDLVKPSHTGWLYQPGDLSALRNHARDLLGDDAKRAAFADAARISMEPRTWRGICGQLVGHYYDAIERKQAQREAELREDSTPIWEQFNQLTLR